MLDGEDHGCTWDEEGEFESDQLFESGTALVLAQAYATDFLYDDMVIDLRPLLMPDNQSLYAAHLRIWD